MGFREVGRGDGVVKEAAGEARWGLKGTCCGERGLRGGPGLDQAGTLLEAAFSSQCYASEWCAESIASTRWVLPLRPLFSNWIFIDYLQWCLCYSRITLISNTEMLKLSMVSSKLVMGKSRKNRYSTPCLATPRRPSHPGFSHRRAADGVRS